LKQYQSFGFDIEIERFRPLAGKSIETILFLISDVQPERFPSPCGEVD
jgi:hypothetical protein